MGSVSLYIQLDNISDFKSLTTSQSQYYQHIINNIYDQLNIVDS